MTRPRIVTISKNGSSIGSMSCTFSMTIWRPSKWRIVCTPLGATPS